jgi:hypothetical protein
MKESRLQELRFLLKTDVPLPVVAERAGDTYSSDIYDDYYTLRELVQHDLLSYIGHKDTVFFLRPRQNFRIFVVDEIRDLKAGEIIRLSLTEAGKTDFVRWLDGAA